MDAMEGVLSLGGSGGRPDGEMETLEPAEGEPFVDEILLLCPVRETGVF